MLLRLMTKLLYLITSLFDFLICILRYVRTYIHTYSISNNCKSKLTDTTLLAQKLSDQACNKFKFSRNLQCFTYYKTPRNLSIALEKEKSVQCSDRRSNSKRLYCDDTHLLFLRTY